MFLMLGPCPYAIAMLSVPAVRWVTRAELLPGLVRSRKMIERDFHRDLSLDRLAQIAETSPYHFQRLFKVTFGESPRTLQTRLRFEHAYSSLQKGASVTDACFRSGFSSLASFSRNFKHRFGVPPSKLA